MIHLWKETNPIITDDPQEVYCRESPKLINFSEPVSNLQFILLKQRFIELEKRVVELEKKKPVD